MVLYPWGFSGSPGLIDNHAYHHQVGLLWRNAIQAQTGKVYRVGNVADILGNAFGASDDHVRMCVKLSTMQRLTLDFSYFRWLVIKG